MRLFLLVSLTLGSVAHAAPSPPCQPSTAVPDSEFHFLLALTSAIEERVAAEAPNVSSVTAVIHYQCAKLHLQPYKASKNDRVAKSVRRVVDSFDSFIQFRAKPSGRRDGLANTEVHFLNAVTGSIFACLTSDKRRMLLTKKERAELKVRVEKLNDGDLPPDVRPAAKVLLTLVTKADLKASDEP